MRALAMLALAMVLAGCAPVRGAVAVAGPTCVPPGGVATADVPAGATPFLVSTDLPCLAPTAGPRLDECPGTPEASACPGAAPDPTCLADPPRHLHATPQPEGILLTWQSPEEGPPARYRIYRALTERQDGVKASDVPLTDVPGTMTSYLDQSAGVGDQDTYWMTSVRGCEGRMSYPASSGHAPPGAIDCAYPDVGLEPPEFYSLYVGLDCLGMGNPWPLPLVLGGGG